MVVAALGLLRALAVHAANIQDHDGAKLVLGSAPGPSPDLHLGRRWLRRPAAGLGVGRRRLGDQLIEKLADATTFAVLSTCWNVERTFPWLGRSWELSKDYEGLPATSEAWVRIAMIQLALKRLAPR